MPLPPALLKRLAKRGIVDKNLKDGPPQKRKSSISSLENPTEEIIAEDYDDDDDDDDDDVEEPYEYKHDVEPQPKKVQENFWSERLKRRIVDGSVNGYRGCPNKCNVHHKCTLYCINKFGDGITEPSSNYLKRKMRLLRRYPLPTDWKEVFDNGCGVHYYWNTVEKTVSWLPPSHPRASITKSAATLRKEMEESHPENEENEENQPQASEGMNIDLPGSQSDANRDFGATPRAAKKQKSRDLDKVIKLKNERRQKREKAEGALDPMDPAAYSDIPRGKWSTGLENENKKTGVDSTVSGTAFQMRPYPSPGAVLEANAAASEASKVGGNPSDNSDAEDAEDAE